MNETTSAVLKKAYRYIKSGEKQQALAILTPIIRAEKNNAEAWFLLGFALSDPEKRIYAFEQVLRLDPANQPAQQQLEKLRHSPVAAAPSGEPIGTTGAQPKPNRRIPALGRILLTGAGILLLGLFVAGAGLLLPKISPATEPPTPTLIIFVTATPRPTITPYPRRATGTPIAALMTPTNVSPLTPPPVEMFDIKDMPADGEKSSVTEIKSAHLDAGASTSLTLDVDENREISFIAKWTGAQPLIVALKDPNGLLMDEAYANTHPEEVVFERSEIITYRIKKPVIGLWIINLTAADAGDYGVLGRFTHSELTIWAENHYSSKINMAWLRVTLFNYPIDETGALLFNKGNYPTGVTGARVRAEITYPDGSFRTISMPDKKDGGYDIYYPISVNASGTVSVHFTATGKNKGVAFTRSTFLKFLVWSNNAIKLTGDYADRIGKLGDSPTIDIDMGVDAVEACTCHVFGFLKAANAYGYMGLAFADLALVAGHNRITLNFIMLPSSKMGIMNSDFEHDGPYSLTVSFQPSKASPISFLAENVWQTAAYHWQQFDH